MKIFILLAVLAAASARPQIIYSSTYSGWPYGAYSAAPVTYSAGATPVTYSSGAIAYQALPIPAVYTVPVATSTQYHAQDELGQASFGYSHPGQARAEVRDAAGSVRGSYSYIGADGKQVITNYVADSVNGFRVEANNLPIAPGIPITPPLVGPAPVQDTAEVAQAKADHAKAVAEAISRNAEADKADAAEEKKDGENKIEEIKAEDKKPEAAEVITSPVNSRRKRSPGGVVSSVYSAYPATAVTYSAHPAVTYSAIPVWTYGGAPVYFKK